MKQPQGPAFVRFFWPILKVLRDLGGSATTAEVIDKVIENLQIPESEQEMELSSGGSRIRNQVQWARLYLVRSGLLDSSKRGIWSLTEAGREANPDNFDVASVFRKVQADYLAQRKLRKEQESLVGEDDQEVESGVDYKNNLFVTIKALPPSGFERLCQRLLRESGFQQVTVTGRTGDGGIDDIGILQVNAFVSFNVLFQCKRYQGAVTPSQVRDFRGAMQGRADMGIVMTTGTFTSDARKEARRDGVPPIELVAGEDLVRLFESLELGLQAKLVDRLPAGDHWRYELKLDGYRALAIKTGSVVKLISRNEKDRATIPNWWKR
jgi:restriction system protein